MTASTSPRSTTASSSRARGLIALSTVLDDELLGEAGDRLAAAMTDLSADWPTPTP